MAYDESKLLEHEKPVESDTVEYAGMHYSKYDYMMVPVVVYAKSPAELIKNVTRTRLSGGYNLLNSTAQYMIHPDGTYFAVLEDNRSIEEAIKGVK